MLKFNKAFFELWYIVRKIFPIGSPSVLCAAAAVLFCIFTVLCFVAKRSDKKRFITPVCVFFSVVFLSVSAVALSAVFTVDVPVIHIVTDDGEGITSSDTYHSCSLSVYNSGSDFKNVPCKVRRRGNVTNYFGDIEKGLTEQVPYRIKFNEKRSMFGLNNGCEFKNWVLVKDAPTAYAGLTLGNITVGSDGYYCSDRELVEVYVNGEWRGVYVLCEQNEVKENRIEINEAPPDHRGTDIGYFFEQDNYAEDEEHWFYTSFGNLPLTDKNGVTMKTEDRSYSIKSDVYSEEQVEFLQKYLTNVFKVLYEACINGNFFTLDENAAMIPFDGCKDSFTAVSSVIDVRSLADMYLLYELDCEIAKGYGGSFFFAVDFSEGSSMRKLTFLSPWDFDATAWVNGDKWSAGAFSDDSEDDNEHNPWFLVVINEDWFTDMVRERFFGVKEDLINAIEDFRSLFCKSGVCEKHFYLKYPAVAAEVYKYNDIADWYLARIDWLSENLG